MFDVNQQNRTVTIADSSALRLAGSQSRSSALKIVILGAGESAWMTAACLSAAFPSELASITVISDAAPHGDFPGESHQPSLFRLLSNLGITEDEFVRRCDGVFEFGTEFQSGSDKYFVAATEVTQMPVVRRIAELQTETLKGRLHHFLPQAAAASLHRAPARFLGPSDLQRFGAYRLSFNGTLFAAMLREFSLRHGVTEIRCPAISIVRRDGGAIGSIQTDHTAGRIDCDLVLCCSVRSRNHLSKEGMARFTKNPDADFAHVSSCFVEIDGETPSFSRAVQQRWELSFLRWQRSGISCDTFRSASHGGRTAEPPEQSIASIWREYACGDAANIKTLVTCEFSAGRCARMWDGNLVFVGAGAMVTDPVVNAGRHLCQTACELLLDYLTAGTESCSVVAKQYEQRLTEVYDSWAGIAIPSRFAGR